MAKHGPNRYILILKDGLTENWNYAGSSGQLSQEYWNVQLSSDSQEYWKHITEKFS